MKHFYTLFAVLSFLLLLPKGSSAQSCYIRPSTTNEFEILSALPQPGNCTAPQPIDRQHEMIHFVVGPADLTIAQLNVTWASGVTWQGVYTPDANTAAKVNNMNSRVVRCGELLEPVFPGVLPAGSQVVLISDTAYDPAKLPFTYLQDSLYVIFQRPGNAAEHMPNFTGTPSLQHSILDFGGTHKDSASYDRSKIGPGIQVRYGANGAIEYINIGCSPAYNKVYSEAGNGGQICQGFKINLSGFVMPGSCHRWSGGTGKFGDSSQLSTTYTPSNTELDTVRLFLTAYSKCDSIKDSVTLIVKKGYNLSAGSGYVLCRGFSVYLQGQADASVSSVLWTTSGSGSFNNPNIRSPLYTPGPSDTTCITLKFTANGACGSLTDSITLCVNPDPTAEAGLGGSYCKPVTIPLTGVATNFTTVKWWGGQGTFSNPNALSTNYTVASSESGIVRLFFSAYNACDSVRDTAIFYIFDAPVIDAGPHFSICANQTVKFTGATSTFGNILWSTSNGTGSFQNGKDTIIQGEYTPGPTDAGSTKNFTVTISTPCGSVSDTVSVTILPIPDASFGGLLDEYCVGDPATTFTGFLPGGVFSGTNVSGTKFDPLTPGTFVVTHTLTINGCTDVKTDTTIVHPKPTGNITVEPAEPEILKDAVFSSNAAPNHFLTWLFGDNATSTEKSPTHIYTEPGTYEVKLAILDTSTGCIDTARLTILVTGPEDIKIPNVFTPNGDNVNDTFNITTLNFRTLNTTIYNRWGQEVFSSAEVKPAWDGTSAGVEAPAGTYYLIVTGQGKSGKDYKFRGTVTIIRN